VLKLRRVDVRSAMARISSLRLSSSRTMDTVTTKCVVPGHERRGLCGRPWSSRARGLAKWFPSR
jgi:hypothetical protein